MKVRFWEDVSERAGKSFVGAVAAFWFEFEVVASSFSLPIKIILFGAGMAVASVCTSLISTWRKPKSGHTTASLLKSVDYIDNSEGH